MRLLKLRGACTAIGAIAKPFCARYKTENVELKNRSPLHQNTRHGESLPPATAFRPRLLLSATSARREDSQPASS